MGAHGNTQLDALGDEVPHLTRDGDADRVRKDDLVPPGFDERAREVEDAARVDGALEGAAKGGADRHRRTDAVGVCSGDDPLSRLQRLLDRGVRVALVEGLGGGERVVDLGEAARD